MYVKVVEVISADDVSLPAAKYGRSVLAPSTNPSPMVSAGHSLPPSSVTPEDYSTSKKEELRPTSSSAQSISPDDQSQSGGAYSREKRTCKPPKRLSDSSDFQPPPSMNVTSWKVRSPSLQ